MSRFRIDLNCDMGEGTGRDAELMPHITAASIACGAHAGTPDTMRETVVLAGRHRVTVGAHPGYPDREGFGRRSMELSPGEIYDIVGQQIGALRDIAREERVPIAHVKPHGALYNDAVADTRIARAVVRAVHDFDRNLLLYALAGSRIITEAERVGMRAVAEAFADRGYEPDGTLMPRGSEGALIEEAGEAATRVVRMVIERRVRARDGSDLRLRAETICIHGDGAHAVEIARQVHAALLNAGIRAAAPGAA